MLRCNTTRSTVAPLRELLDPASSCQVVVSLISTAAQNCTPSRRQTVIHLQMARDRLMISMSP